MRIAVVGGGVSGLVAAHLLSREHQVHLYEANDYLGGHTHTHTVEQAGRQYRVDSGFIVFNELNYPLFSRLLAQLGVAWQRSDMSFSSRNERTGIEYKAHTLASLFSQKRNLLRPDFHRMIRDIVRFYRQCPVLLESPDPGPATGDYLGANGYSPMFIHDHLLPMASALWSAPPSQILAFPIRYMVQFFSNHRMLQLKDRPEWRVVSGGSDSYVAPLSQPFSQQLHLSTPIRQVRRDAGSIEISTGTGERANFDRIVFACHSDQALAMLAEPTPAEREILGAIAYQANEVTLHTDRSPLPKNPKAWSAWNALVPNQAAAPCTVTYNMNTLQTLDSPEPFCVSLNCNDRIDPVTVLKTMTYHHPIYTHAAVKAQSRKSEISGGIDNGGNTFYCGAYWGFGFHEDGVRSGVEVASQFGIQF